MTAGGMIGTVLACEGGDTGGDDGDIGDGETAQKQEAAARSAAAAAPTRTAAAGSAAAAAPTRTAAAGSAAAPAKAAAGLVQQGSSSSSPAPAPCTPPSGVNLRKARTSSSRVVVATAVQLKLCARPLAARRMVRISSSGVVVATASAPRTPPGGAKEGADLVTLIQQGSSNSSPAPALRTAEHATWRHEGRCRPSPAA